MTELGFELALGLALLVLPLLIALGWPLLRHREAAPAAEAEQVALANLYREHLAELEAARASGALDERQYAALQAELARNLLAAEGGAANTGDTKSGNANSGGRGLLYGLLVSVPVAALALYFHWGSYSDLALYRDILASQQGRADDVQEARITQQLRARAESHPDDLTGRYVLAQRLLVNGDLPGAVAQYRYVVEREPQAAGIKAELAQALFFAGGSRISDEIRRLVEQALEVDPHNGTALGLAGIAAFERRDFRAARDFWQRALDLLAPGSAAAEALAAGIARANAALGEDGETAVAAVAETQNGATGEQAVQGPSIRVRVTLAEGVDAPPATPVFIYARTAESPMPLAIVRLAASQLPAEVVLDESRAMMPGRSLSSVDSVQLVARLALHGDARPALGDWQGIVESLPESEWSKPVSITIDSEL